MTAPETTAPTIPRLSVTELRHELRTPLNQIIGYSEMLQEEAAELGQESFVADLAKIERAGRRLLGLINELTSGKKADPLPAAPEPGPHAPRVEEQAAHRPGAPENLLVVDDSEENRDLLARRLQHKGFVVHTAAGGREAMALLSTRSFDLVLLDVMMPEVSGLDVLKGHPHASLALGPAR
jgi:Response regulator containing CheY-like receiver, AAA-type ATPase, and DNA-binding domains